MTAPGEQAGPYIGADGKQRRVWVFVMTMGWSRACYVELVRKASSSATSTLLGRRAAPVSLRQCQGDHAGPGEEKRPIWNQRMLLRLAGGF